MTSVTAEILHSELIGQTTGLDFLPVHAVALFALSMAVFGRPMQKPRFRSFCAMPTLCPHTGSATNTATFHVCARCGAVPFVTSEIASRLYAVVNVNTFEGFDPIRLRRATFNFEGEGVEARLSRRAKNWING